MEKIIYTIDLFFIYALFGFIWETLWVSFNEGHFVQRGFLHGPILPIYGFGAVIIIAMTEPLKGNNIAIYFVGMITATLLELITGYALEKLFHVRYWDYDNRPFNYKGYICLRSSLFWGLLPIFLVNDVNMWIKNFLSNIPINLIIFFTCVSLFIFFIDLWKSVEEALALKDILNYEREFNQYIVSIKKELRQYAEEKKEEFFDSLEQIGEGEKSISEAENILKRKAASFVYNKIEERRAREQKVYIEIKNYLNSKAADENLSILSKKALQLLELEHSRRIKRLNRAEKRIRSLLKRNDISIR
ncbi:MAG: putative ABC transporter permease [Tissierellia bacterium]|nr:putative ABC transporter permease [Tissierellia bacterium]